MQTFTLPRYLFDEEDLINLIEKCTDIMGETLSPELEPVTRDLLSELNSRGIDTYHIDGDGNIIQTRDGKERKV